MTNVLGAYKPIAYANEALIWLKKALGMAQRVHRGYDEENKARRKGEPITIRRPSTFVAQDAPATAQDINTGTVTITLDYWKDVAFKLTDRELAQSDERIISDHIMPAAYALADFVDQKLALLAKDVPTWVDLNATPGSVVTDITNVYQKLFDQRVPLQNPNELFYMVDGVLQNGFQANAAFSQWNGSGPVGVEAQLSGALGRRFGLNLFANQNVQSHTKGTASTGTLFANGAALAGATSMAIDANGGGLTGTLVAGDTFTISGHTQAYAVTATATASGNAFASVSFTPALEAGVADNTSITASLDNHTMNMAFHRHAFALVVAPLPSDLLRDNFPGAQIATAMDPVSGLSIRASTYYEPREKTANVSLDILFGVKTLNPNLAVRARG